jgi:hypothetical protein
LPLLSICASAANSSGVIVWVEYSRNSGPYCRHVSAGSLSRLWPTKEEQLGRLADNLIDEVHRHEDRKQDHDARNDLNPSRCVRELPVVHRAPCFQRRRRWRLLLLLGMRFGGAGRAG